ncbi:hypothetical protein [Streptomyces sp. NBC_01477]|uniref:hypothetical protein n=1 Tax=Streptomyces sp. NBC_01477 TaxID=2976015 RepID=UPI002E34A886|nr:hypothetical protein [Streptomyces sp. NBC_01477]
MPQNSASPGVALRRAVIGLLLLAAAVLGPLPGAHAAPVSAFTPGAAAWKDQNGNPLRWRVS